jgi:peptidoglycan/xylan/chitin deacetylase (PgdA/CDA1 family)
MRMLGLKRNAKIAISLIYYAFVTVFRGGLRIAGLPVRRRLIILYYHGLPANYRLRFARQMDLLQRLACVLPASYRGDLPSDKRCVAITFDDAFQSVLEHAVPELAARSFHATIFVPVGFVGRNPRWEMEEGCSDLDEVVMTTEQLRALSSSAISIGSHTKTHSSITAIDKKRAQDEIESSRYQLADLCGQNILTFSFPYGHHDSSAVAMCSRAGYEHVYSIVPEEVDTTKPEILRGRTKVEPSDGLVEFFLKFNGAYVWMAHIAELRQKLRLIKRAKHVPFETSFRHKWSPVKNPKKR